MNDKRALPKQTRVRPELRLRITVIRPPQDVLFRLQRGRAELVPPARERKREISFELTVRLGPSLPGGRPRFLGPCVQGPPQARFVYVNSGTYAGQKGSCWSRRAKVPLTGITSTIVAAALARSDGVLEARIAGAGRDGGPACGTVALVDPGWELAGAKH